MSKVEASKIKVRNATIKDVKEIAELSKSVYGKDFCFKEDHIRGQINTFPQGQFVVLMEDNIVGYCSTFIISAELALKPHTFKEITGHGFGSLHDPNGEYLYGMEVCVDKNMRGMKIGGRLYAARKKLCQNLELKGIVFGGRLPGYGKYHKKGISPEEYIEMVKERKIRDKVLSFQLSHDYECIGVLKDYLPKDEESLGYAAHMIWRNPLTQDKDYKKNTKRGRLPNTVRIISVQFQVRKVTNETDFEQHLEYFIDVASDYGADFIVFPEMLTVSLLSAQPQKLDPAKSIELLSLYTERFIKFMQDVAVKYNINIIGGSHPTKTEDGIHNICDGFLRDGSVYSQTKIHPTPNERYWWNIKGGDKVKTIPTDCGPIGVLICYDSEFPELARHLTDQGALMLFVPFCTDERQGYLRVKYCCQARAVENQIFVITSGMVGNLPDVENMDIHYAESGIFTPCDFNFSRDGIAAITNPNTEMICMADLRIENLMISRNSGTVQNLKDRRFDLYKVDWTDKKD